MPYIHYSYDPNKPGSKEEARARAYRSTFGGIFGLIGLIGSIIYYSKCASSLFQGNVSSNSLEAIGLYLVSNIIMFRSIFDKDIRKEMRRIYWLYAIGAFVALTSVLLFIYALNNLNAHEERQRLLIIAIVVFLATIIAVFALRKKAKKSFNEEADVTAATEKLTNQFTVRNKQEVGKETEEHCENIVQKEADKEMAEAQGKDTNTNNSESTNFIYCRKCGKKMLGDSLFCSACGAKLE